jgi:hypothetical protein
MRPSYWKATKQVELIRVQIDKLEGQLREMQVCANTVAIQEAIDQR